VTGLGELGSLYQCRGSGVGGLEGPIVIIVEAIQCKVD
jgi:hypothetical protein